MGEMRVRIEDGLRTRLEESTREHNRSLDEEVVLLLEKGLEIHARESLYDAARRIAAMTPKGVKQTDSVEMLREDRDR